MLRLPCVIGASTLKFLRICPAGAFGAIYNNSANAAKKKTIKPFVFIDLHFRAAQAGETNCRRFRLTLERRSLRNLQPKSLMPLQSGEIRPKLGASRLSIYLRRMPFSSKPAAAPRGKSPTGRTIPAPLAAELLRLSNGERWGLDVSQFSVILESISVKYLPEDCNDAECKSMLKELKLEELALARACAAGNENAWTEFLTRYRERLYGAALSIAKDSSRARDLADGLYAELYGLKTRDGGGRVSKLEYYSGRGSLEGWLRTILSQNYINEFRSRRNQDSLDEEEEQGSQFAAPAPELPNPHLGAVNKVL